jgi:hypothetical protein
LEANDGISSAINKKIKQNEGDSRIFVLLFL